MGNLLEGKVAVVTGGSNGLGEGTVRRFVEEGAKVVIADVNAEDGEALADELGAPAIFLKTDVSQREQVQAAVDLAVKDFGGLDVMFNNAGVSQKAYLRFVDDELSDFDRLCNINLKGVMLGTQIAGRYMKDQGKGSIINNASMGGVLAGYGLLIYRSIKAAVIHFSKCAAIDFAEYNVRVNVMSPGLIETSMATFPEPGMTDEQINKVNVALRDVKNISMPLKRQGQPEDVGNGALYLASDMSAQVTGLNLTIDGGMSVGDPVNHLKDMLETRAQVLAEIRGES